MNPSTSLRTKLLAVDIGNTSMHFAVYSGGRWKNHFWLPTHASERVILKGLLKKARILKGAEAAIASVVPSRSRMLKTMLERRLGLRCKLIGTDIRVPVVNRHKNPRQVGVDRLLNALAAYKRYKRELIIIDFGTAITFDVVSKKGEYLGGIIAPGIEISIEALFKKTALLPRIRLKHPRNFIGKDTVESIRVGCSVGIGGLCDGVVESVSRKYHMKPLVVATGGYAAFIRRYCRSIRIIQKDLILEGIRLSFPGLGGRQTEKLNT